MDLSVVTIIYIAVAVIGIIIALVLAHLGRQQLHKEPHPHRWGTPARLRF